MSSAMLYGRADPLLPSLRASLMQLTEERVRAERVVLFEPHLPPNAP